MSRQKPGDRPVPSWPAIILWPFAVACLNLVSIVYVLALASIETGRTSLRAADALMKGLGEWGSALMTDAIPFATVIATLLIAVGAATGFSGNWRTVGPQARKFLGFAAIVSLVTMAGILAFALPVVVARPDRVPDVVVIFVVGWVVTLIGFAVSSVRTPDEWLEAARKERDRRKAVALTVGG